MGTRTLYAMARSFGRHRCLLAGLLLLVQLLLLSSLAMAAPVGGQVTSGSGSVSRHGSTTTIHQASRKLSLSWKGFNVAANETVNFKQPNASAVAVNRISDTHGSIILGHINANGNIYLINPNGILFGKTAQVNVGGLVASTLDTTDGSHFSGSGTGSIVNEGTINAQHYVALLGNSVTNSGVITAQLGTVAMGAGDDVSLTFSGNHLVKLRVNKSVIDSLVANHGLIQADGGTVIMSAGARDSLLASVVNNDGIVQAQTVDRHHGTITLLGGMAAGTVNAGGRLDASAPNGGNGGAIETSAAHVRVADGTAVDTRAADGLDGSWLIDPVDFMIASATLAANRSHVVIHLSGGGQGHSPLHVDDDAPSTTTTTATTTPTPTAATDTALSTSAADTVSSTSTTMASVKVMDVIAVSDALLAPSLLTTADAYPGGQGKKAGGKHRKKHHSRGDAVASDKPLGSGMLHIDGSGVRLSSGAGAI